VFRLTRFEVVSLGATPVGGVRPRDPRDPRARLSACTGLPAQ
jgi:hypothetical protein